VSREQPERTAAELHEERVEALRARRVAQRAIRRLDFFEWLIFLVVAGVATVGGAMVAWLIAPPAGWDFRWTWIGASLLLFIVPGTIALIRIRRDEREQALRTSKQESDDG
jgi:uncharacterized membrane protein